VFGVVMEGESLSKVLDYDASHPTKSSSMAQREIGRRSRVRT
jgi:hypothetical protein